MFSILEIGVSIYFAVVDNYRFIVFAVLELVLIAFYIRGCIGKLTIEQVLAKKYFTIVHLITFILNAVAFIIYLTLDLIEKTTRFGLNSDDDLAYKLVIGIGCALDIVYILFDCYLFYILKDYYV